MKKTLSTHEAASLLAAENSNGFTYSGAHALCEYLEELEADTGEEIEFDLVAIRCDFAEYASLGDFRANYLADEEQARTAIGADEGADMNQLTREYILGRGTLIEFDGGIIVSAF